MVVCFPVVRPMPSYASVTLASDRPLRAESSMGEAALPALEPRRSHLTMSPIRDACDLGPGIYEIERARTRANIDAGSRVE